MNKKVKGSTLIEALVAMTLIVTTVSFFFLSAGNINKSFRTGLKAYAFTQADKILIDTISGSGEYVFEYPSFTIKKSVKPYGLNPDLMSITVEVITHDEKQLFEMKKIIFIKDR